MVITQSDQHEHIIAVGLDVLTVLTYKIIYREQTDDILAKTGRNDLPSVPTFTEPLTCLNMMDTHCQIISKTQERTQIQVQV